MSAQVYLVSPEVAAAASLTGEFTDPRALDMPCPEIERPDRFEIDDSMFVFPAGDGSGVEIVRGPNIGTVPKGEALPEDLSGVATIKVGDKITTDHIMPAGARLKYRSNVETYSTFVFENTDPEFASRAASHRDAGLHNVVIAGESYGQGSSREHAALCPMFLGVRAVVAKSIERIHRANLINFGIVPFAFENADDYEQIDEGDRVEIRGVREAVSGDGHAALTLDTKGTEIPIHVELSDRQRGILLAGGLLNTVAG
jgi:aconitate hydratase